LFFKTAQADFHDLPSEPLLTVRDCATSNTEELPILKKRTANYYFSILMNFFEVLGTVVQVGLLSKSNPKNFQTAQLQKFICSTMLYTTDSGW